MSSDREGLKQSTSKFRSNAAQILAVSIKNTLLLSYGLTLGFPTILIPGLQQQDAKVSFNLSKETISWISSLHLICVPVGCTVSGAITECLGRKRTMQLVNIPFLFAWLMFSYATNIYVIFIALCLVGLSGGMLEAPVITYVAEICQPRLRGILSATSTVAVIGGVLLQFFLGTFFNWRTVALINCFFPVLSFSLLFIVPESAHWLILKNRLLDAKKSIAWLRGWASLEEIEAEYKSVYNYISNQETAANSADDNPKTQEISIIESIKLYTKRNFLWPYALVTFCFFLSQFCGMTTLQTFAVQIFASLRAPINKYVATVYLGVAEILGCIVCVCLIRKLGKRIINFASLIGVGTCFLLVATYAYMIDMKQLITLNQNVTETGNHEDSNPYEKYSWAPMSLLILAAFLTHMGIRVLPWILTGEIYSNETRAAASGLSGAIAYIFGFLANKTFLSLIESFTLPGVFWFNSAVAFVGCGLLYVLLPETEGKPLEEITDHFKGLKRMTNSVRGKKKNETQIENGKVNDGYHLDNIDKEANTENHI